MLIYLYKVKMRENLMVFRDSLLYKTNIFESEFFESLVKSEFYTNFIEIIDTKVEELCQE